MFFKESKNGLSKLGQALESPLYPSLVSGTSIEDCLTPTTLAFFDCAMTESNDQSYAAFSGYPQEKSGAREYSGAANVNDDNYSEDETGEESSESLDLGRRVVPASSQYTSDQQQTQTGSGQTKVKSLKRKLPGPRPAFSDDELTEEEMQRRVRRRERNKMAASRCRQRRVDQTNELLTETKQLETEANRLEKEIESLERLKSKLEIVLQSHIPLCTANIQDVQVSSTSSDTSSTSIYLASTPQSNLVLMTLPSSKQPKIVSSNLAPTESLINTANFISLRPNTLPGISTSVTSGNSTRSTDTRSNLFNFDLPPISSASISLTPDLSFSASDFLTPTTLEQQKLFD